MQQYTTQIEDYKIGMALAVVRDKFILLRSSGS
jgi:aromatic ring-opening dioxygenase catalytic subunit (LigB family)